MQRVVETNNGIQDIGSVKKYDDMQKDVKSNGWLKDKVDFILGSSEPQDKILEIGQGPGLLGLECLKCLEDALLVGVDVSANMVDIAIKNASEYGLSKRTVYINCDAHQLCFGNNQFDCIISSYSLHEWENPVLVFKEMERVLKKKGKVCLIDFRRDANTDILNRRVESMKDKDMREGYLASVNASYTKKEIEKIMSQTCLVIEEMKVYDVEIFLTLKVKGD